MRGTDALIFPSACALGLLEKFAGKESAVVSRASVLPGRVDASVFCPAKDGDSEGAKEGGGDLRGELGIGPDELILGIVSRVKIERRHDLLIRAFARALPKIPTARLCIFGRGEHVPEVKALIAELGVGERIIWGGYRTGSELVRAYRTLSAKVWLVQGNDGTSRAVLEALASGIPVIAGSGGAQADIVRDGTDGLVVPLNPAWRPGDADGDAEIEALSEALAALSDTETRRRMSESARQRALDFVPERRAERLEKIYEAALERKYGRA